jgi:sortase A
MLGIYAGVRIHQAVFAKLAVRTFERRQQQLKAQASEGVLAAKTPDFTLWSPKRIQLYEESFSAHLEPTLALLRIPSIELEVPVLPGTDELTLNRGVGLIEGTARPQEGGNVGIAGHRDGFFRKLKDVREGDRIDLVTDQGTDNYLIDRIVIVQPEDTSVLVPRSRPSVTLVTCYPFYFVGSAPQRYIVQASLSEPSADGSEGHERISGQTQNVAVAEKAK